MPCFRPLKGYQHLLKDLESGKRKVFFKLREGYHDKLIQIACGQCRYCRLRKSKDWAIRMMHEAKQYDRNCFITLTYDPEFLPPGGTLVKKHFQDFMKRLRRKYGSGIRFYHCGEYGDKFMRPHYHACIFNFDFDDKVHWKTVNGYKYYTSKKLSRVWTFAGKRKPIGHVVIGELTFESAAYVARYVTKKITGPKAKYKYWKPVLLQDGSWIGEISELLPEYSTMSRAPGIGRGWFDRFSSDVYPSDEVILGGRKMRPPKYYDQLFSVANPAGFRKLKERRRKLGENAQVELETLSDRDVSHWRDRLADLEQIQELKFQQLKRGYDAA